MYHVLLVNLFRNPLLNREQAALPIVRPFFSGFPPASLCQLAFQPFRLFKLARGIVIINLLDDAVFRLPVSL